ncbi:hypothetical protein BDB00DRAFT_801821 [Zychaea mexicana]|uniref:uncharacterized protein n=1 Tax=Zychaea mexicana TaxID=64656 RepID=UPI0022FF1AE5|nr:uncharacterized protein BDB00DRAFT_801821 [Zychaea mexicana]KAI9498266.1 hypothetical protein BDB00DRAFT_801821 [Zychaea mexicana]
MRFSLSLISTAMLATMAMAAPATPQENNNSELDVAPAQNVALQMGEKFEPFNWMAAEGEGMSADRTFTLNLAEPAQLQITDYKLGGDSFEIMDNGEVLGMTSEAANDEEAFAATPEEALQDERFSHAVFDLAQGEHEITINVANSPFADGTGAVRVVQKVQALYEKKGGKGKGKKGGWGDDDDEWDDDKDDDKWDDDEDWEDDDDEWDDKDDDKKGGWGDDKKGGWGDDKKGGWGDDKKGGWGDDKKGGWGDDKKGDWEDDKWDGKKDWDKKKTVYVYYTVPGAESSPSTVTLTTTSVRPTTKTVTVTSSSFQSPVPLETRYITTPTAFVTEEATETSFVTETATETELNFLELPFLTL